VLLVMDDDDIIIHTYIYTYIYIYIYIYIYVFWCGAAAQRGPGPPHSRGFSITHNDEPQSVGLLSTSDQLVAETST